jgi:hypothetical protein
MKTLLLIAGVAALLPVGLRAQPAGGTEFEATMGMAFGSEVKADNGRHFDEVQVTQFGAKAGQSFSVAPATRASLAVAYDRFDFSGLMILPDAVQSWTVDAGLRHRVDDQWMLLGAVAPAFNNVSGDDFGADGLGVTVRAIALYRQSAALTWSFGAVYRSLADSDYRVLPVFGFDWRPSPEWSVALGFPRSAVTWHVTRELRFSFGASAQGGTFFIKDRPWTLSSIPPLVGTKLEYRELRLGLRAEYAPAAGWELFASSGLVVVQQFDFFDRNYELKAQHAAPYVSAGAKFTF